MNCEEPRSGQERSYPNRLLVYFWLARPALKETLSQVAQGNRNIDKVKAGPVEVDLSEAKEKIRTELTGISKQAGKSDAPPSEKAVAFAKALDNINKASDDLRAASLNDQPKGPAEAANTANQTPFAKNVSWVYVGRPNGLSWNPNYFGVHNVPNPGATINSTHWVNQRSAFPKSNPLPNEPSNYDLATVIGVLSPNQPATVLEMRSIVSDQGGLDWWARIQ